MKAHFLEVVIMAMILLILLAMFAASGNRYKEVCIGGVAYVENTQCLRCSLTPKIDAQTLQPQRCAVEKVP